MIDLEREKVEKLKIKQQREFGALQENERIMNE